MELETDLQRIARLAEENEEENWNFRSFLKQVDMDFAELDAIVHRLAGDVSNQIDCTKCGNCCKQVRPVLDKRDVKRFAEGLNVSVGEFSSLHLIQDEEEASKRLFNALPCPFLKDNKCTNYEHRPHDCSSFPHLQKEKFVTRLWGVIDNYAICPIVFNVYEQLKTELGYVGSYDPMFDDSWDESDDPEDDFDDWDDE